MKQQRFFASDNSSTVHPLVVQAMLDANVGHEISYGQDRYTEDAIVAIRRAFGTGVDVGFVYNGTGANVLGMQAALRSFNAVICSDVSHINTDECGAPEAITGAKLLPVPSRAGKLSPSDIEPHLSGIGVEHHSQPTMLSLTQSTELGTVYSVSELTELCNYAHENGLLVHLDGARIANAAASLDVHLKAITADVGVDILSFGGTKNGLMFGEAVVFFRHGLSDTFPYVRKQGMQLASKMRFIGAQFTAFLRDDLWMENARHANEMARRLEHGVSGFAGIEIVYPVEANALFVKLPKDLIPRIQAERFFYLWEENSGVARWMTSWDTTEEDVDSFIAFLHKVL